MIVGILLKNYFDVSVKNYPPTIQNGLENQAINAITELNYQFDINTFHDPEGFEFTYSANITDPDAQGWLNFDNKTRTFSGKPNNPICSEKNYTNIEVIAEDSCGHIISDFFDIQVTNEKPRINKNLINQRINSTGFQHGLILTTKQEHGTPPQSSCSETIAIKLTAIDDCNYQTEQFFDIIINKTNVTLSKELNDENYNVDELFSFSFDEDTFIDPREMGLTYSIKLSNGSETPDWIHFNSNDRTFFGTTEGCTDDIIIEIIAEDYCKVNASGEFHLQITNRKPQQSQHLKNQVCQESESFTLNFEQDLFIDPEQSEIDYEIGRSGNKQLPDWIKFDQESLSVSGVCEGDETSIDIDIIGYDDCRESGKASFNLKINLNEEESFSLFEGTMLYVSISIISLIVFSFLLLSVIFILKKKKKHNLRKNNNNKTITLEQYYKNKKNNQSFDRYTESEQEFDITSDSGL
ncbi:dystroglycan-related [Anaeramoeba flamelloides]|uniref:Dystroglycan-related n=1 Tax=Anaeramoeba flamelloides TaxID=1746091 RepID=A0AAV7Z451_9EUKA|nr:dystroglycan-related [Anaeramoeba flamelloides]